MSFERLRRLVFGASVLFALLGLGIALVGGSPLFDLYNRQIDRVFFGGSIPPPSRELRAFLYGVLGGTIAGKWVLMSWIAAVPLARRERWAHRASLAALLVWFAIDSSVSLAHGAAFNVLMINLFPLVIVGVPLLLMGPACGVAVPPVRGQRALRLVALVLVAVGVALAVLGLAAIPTYSGRVARAFFDAVAVPADPARFADFMAGAIGGTIAGHGVGVFAVARYRPLAADRAAAAAIGGSLLVWFAIDSTLSLVHGAAFNVWLVNVPSLVAIFVPLVVSLVNRSVTEAKRFTDG